MEQDLEQVSQIHGKLVDGLKKSLLIGQLGFLKAARFLYEIHEKKTYLSEDSSRETTFSEFCQRVDIPLPGRTAASRLRIAQRFIRTYKVWILEKGFEEQKLAPVGYSKLDLLIPVIQKEGQKADEWLDKALILSATHLIQEVRHYDKSLADLMECQHKNIKRTVSWKCEDCDAYWRHDPRDK